MTPSDPVNTMGRRWRVQPQTLGWEWALPFAVLRPSVVPALAGVVTGDISRALKWAIGIAGGNFAASILLSRPAYARWRAGYAALRTSVANAPPGRAAVISNRIVQHVRQLGELSRNDPQLAPVYRASA
jgi:hypothetical protein